MKLTAEKFIREKVRSKYEVQGEMKALHTYSITGEEALRWAHEFAFCLDNWISVDIEPEFGGEYNVVWDLGDGEPLVTTTMDYDKRTKEWIDTAGSNKSILTVKFWQPLPSPKTPQLIQVSNSNIKPGK